MRSNKGAIVLLLLILLFASNAFSASPALLTAKQAAEAEGFIFAMSHDEIINQAKKEGRVKILSGWD